MHPTFDQLSPTWDSTEQTWDEEPQHVPLGALRGSRIRSSGRTLTRGHDWDLLHKQQPDVEETVQ